jgi:hypothetical protein
MVEFDMPSDAAFPLMFDYRGAEQFGPIRLFRYREPGDFERGAVLLRRFIDEHATQRIHHSRVWLRNWDGAQAYVPR